MTPGEPVVERKHKPDGTIREYPCQLIHASASVVVIRYDMPSGGGAFVTPFEIPPGSWSFGFFWPKRPFNLYRMRGPGDRVLGHRFDAATAVRLASGALSYRDLALDWWVLPDDTLLEEDRDEFDQLVASGLLSQEDAALVNQASRHIYSRYRHVIDDAATLERRLKLLD